MENHMEDNEICAVGGLGLVLMWYRTKGSCARGLALLFGQTSTPLYRWIQFGRMILLKAIIQDPDVKVSMPSLEDVTVFKNAISDKYPVLDNVWGAVEFETTRASFRTFLYTKPILQWLDSWTFCKFSFSFCS